MSKTTSIVMGAHYADFAARHIAAGRFGSVSEVVRAGLRLLEEREARLAGLQASTAYPPSVPQQQWEAHAEVLKQRQARRTAKGGT